ESRPAPGGASEQAPTPRLEGTPAGPTRIETLHEVAADENASGAGPSQAPDPSDDGVLTNQERLDSAMEFYQASSDFWDQGDLDNAMGALDKAYSLILQVKQNADPELLQQKEDLRITISRRIVEVYSSRFTVANGNHMAIPLVMNDEVEKALKLFKGPHRKFFLESYRRSGQYRPMILEALREAGLPEELSWLPLIESGYKVRALSRARALGLWQFIASTGYKFGLKRDQWIDERMDPEKATLAAIGYLKELHQIFGEWTTVLAAYNCGERRVLDRIKTQKIQYLDDFWDLYRRLPRETAFYVPKFLAVLHIVNNPEAHGFDLPEVDAPRPVDVVAVDKQIHLKTIAQHLGMSYDLLREMNPELRQYLTPEDPYTLKVPKGKGETLVAKLGDIPAWSPPQPTYVVHQVRKGQTLSGIARRYGTSVQAVMNMNGLRSKNYVKVGWRLKVPTRGGTAAVAAAYSKKGGLTTYRVRKGDSLWKIAKRFSTTTGAIQSVNGLRTTRLQVGQTLKVPAGSRSGSSATVRTYRVKRGDSPYLIARRHRMELSDFLKVNRLTPTSTIYPGQVVKVTAN
ncbi:MAG: LysM peptidoglycan-binding domain-containing protein, partial [Deltaproteobacteria bacterium]|nr:LysM peptidoglycan-binding domain-containing protein [Deltaproteobacteria bacterium]